MNEDRIKVELSSGGGKACRGYAKTGTVQIRDYMPNGDFFIKKQFRFNIGDRDSLRKATFKAMQYAKSLRELTP